MRARARDARARGRARPRGGGLHAGPRMLRLRQLNSPHTVYVSVNIPVESHAFQGRAACSSGALAADAKSLLRQCNARRQWPGALMHSFARARAVAGCPRSCSRAAASCLRSGVKRVVLGPAAGRTSCGSANRKPPSTAADRRYTGPRPLAAGAGASACSPRRGTRCVCRKRCLGRKQLATGRCTGERTSASALAGQRLARPHRQRTAFATPAFNEWYCQPPLWVFNGRSVLLIIAGSALVPHTRQPPS